MARIQEKIFNEMATKLCLEQNDKLTNKAIEILELVKAKSSEILKHLNENAKVILCLDISCELLNLPFAQVNMVVSQSSMKKSVYIKNKKIIKKILNLEKKMTIEEVIRKLGITHSGNVEKVAKDIYRMYLKQQAYENHEIDSWVFALCVYFACKFENIKVSKKNVLSLSNLTHTQLINREKSWEKWTSSLNIGNKNKLSKKESSKEHVSGVEYDDEDLSRPEVNKNNETNEESYEEWAKRILDAAREKIFRLKY